jgi:hypothetical protein
MRESLFGLLGVLVAIASFMFMTPILAPVAVLAGLLGHRRGDPFGSSAMMLGVGAVSVRLTALLVQAVI